MTNKASRNAPPENNCMNLKAAVEHFVAQGGVIDIIASSEYRGSSQCPLAIDTPTDNPEQDKMSKLELLKELITKGAGFAALQYSLKMNKREIRQLAAEYGLKIISSRPLKQTRKAQRLAHLDVDDAVAGHVMHYSSLGYTAHEIASILDLSVRELRNIAKAYRFEFKTM